MPTRIYNKLSSQPTPKVIQFTKLKEKMPMASQLSAPTMVSTSAITLKTLNVLFTSKSLLIYLLVVCVLWQNICIAVCQGLLTSPCISGIITKMCCNVASLSKRPYVLDVTQKRASSVTTRPPFPKNSCPTVRDCVGVVCSVRIVNTLVLLCNNTKAYFLADKEGFYDKRKTRTQTV